MDARAREQQTPLHIASRLGNVDIVVLLLQSGAQVDAVTKDLYTALHISAKEGQEEVAGVLLDHNASLDAETKKGFTPLHLAAKYGNIKVYYGHYLRHDKRTFLIISFSLFSRSAELFSSEEPPSTPRARTE